MPLNIDWQQILLHLLNFLILAVGLYFILYKPVKKFMKKREDDYAAREEKTAEALKDAESSRAEYEDKLARAEEEIASLKKSAAAETEAVRAERLRDAETEAEGIVAAARGKAQEEKRKIIEGVGTEIRDIVGSMAEKVVASDKVKLSSGLNDAYEEFLSAAEKDVNDGK